MTARQEAGEGLMPSSPQRHSPSSCGLTEVLARAMASIPDDAGRGLGPEHADAILAALAAAGYMVVAADAE